MSNPILYIKDAGYGETPIPTDAEFALGDAVQARISGVWQQCEIYAVVPAGVSPDHAAADQNGRPRPLMVMHNRRRTTSYVVKPADDEGLVWCHRRQIREAPE